MSLENLQNFDPTTCISGKMMRLQRATANIFRKHLQPFQVTDSQLSLLFILTKMDGTTQKQLAQFAVLEKSSLNRNLRRLFEFEYATREDFPIIQITPKGKEFVNQVIPVWEGAMKEIKELLGAEGEEALHLLHSKLINHNIP